MNPTQMGEALATPLVTPDKGLASRRPPHQGIEYCFGLLLAIFGVAFAFTLPPGLVPDERGHLIHSYDLAKGHLLPTHDPEGWAGAVVPVNLLPLIDQQRRLRGHPEEKWTGQDVREMLNLRFTGEQCLVGMGTLSPYNFVPYLPQAAGIRLARWLKFRPLLVFYAGRLGNLTFGIFCVVLAIRLAPIGKLLFGAIALLPLNVQQFGSLSADTTCTGLSLLLVAALLRLALSSGTSRPPALTLGLLLLLTLGVALIKFPYTVLVLLYFGIPAGQAGSRRRYWLTGMLVLAVAAAGLAASWAMTRPYVLDPHRFCGAPISPSGGAHFVLTHPLDFLGVFLNSVAERGWVWLNSLFVLGVLDTPLNSLTSVGYLFFLAVLALADGRQEGALPWRLWSVGAAVTFLGTGLILTTLYVWWSPLGSKLIEGPQGRYFIPLLPMFFLLLRNGGIRVKADERFLARMTLAVTLIFLTYAWVALANRFYFRQPPLLLSPPAMCGLGFMALLLCWARYRWLLSRATTDRVAPSALDAGSRLQRQAA